ncbi:FMN-dependent NADH-azoreductase [Paramixta manurensis]|uniref:FMN dependent NADH:quinone oxidoreductase n=1 Tax=Paramixta manurensis TaxID=2740817 RepID=A0A6M8UA39_9GAMM|nr:FMN-dependent NADH-azoreductase [Erwiniaceae bacterium PD-1]
MNSILALDFSPYGENSLGMKLGNEAINRLVARYPQIEVVRHSFGQAILSPIEQAYVRAITDGCPASDPAFEHSERLIAELERADWVLLSTPMHNFTVPAALKLWIDYIVRAGRTFDNLPEGKVGLLKDKPLRVVVRSGGLITGERARQQDFLTPYLRYALESIGLKSVEFIYLEGLAPQPEALSAAAERLSQLLIT